MRKLLIFICLSFGFLNVSAQNNYYENLFEKANVLYDQAQYDSSAQLYFQIYSSGFTSFELFYNLGNASFKRNHLPEAILYYEKAKKLKPLHPDLLFNLDMANAQIVDKIKPVPKFFVTEFWENQSFWFTPNQWAVLAFSLFFVTAILVFFFIRSALPQHKKVFFYLSAICSLLFLLAINFGLIRNNQYYNTQEAIVFVPSLTVKSEPSQNATDLFLLHEGTKVLVSKNEDNWVKIELPDGNVGWVDQSALAVI